MVAWQKSTPGTGVRRGVCLVEKRKRAERLLGALLSVVLSAQVLLGGTCALAETPSADGPDYQSVGEVPSDSATDSLVAGEDYEPGQVIVGFKDPVDSASAQRALDDAVTVADDSPSTLSTADDSSDEAIDDHTAVVQLEDGASVGQAVTELSQSPEVSYVQPNYIYTMSDDPSDSGQGGTLSAAASVNDPNQYQQWYLGSDNFGIDARRAWDIAKGSDSNVSVAVIDTGCDTSHEDLATNILGTYNATDDSSNVTDGEGHGTSVCGIISAVADNGKGIAGVSYNSKLVVVKANKGDSRDFDSGTISKALRYVVSNRGRYNIRVINMSLSAAKAGFGQDYAIYNAVDDVYDAGILVVAAAGNKDSWRAPYASVPGDYEKCLSVMNMTNGGELSQTSNYNEPGSRSKDLCAPGTDICSCLKGSRYSTPGSNLSGTSFAAPMVSAVAALCFTANPGLSAASCTSVLEETATDRGASGWDDKYGYGEVNAYAAVRRAKDSAASSLPSPSSGSTGEPSKSSPAAPQPQQSKIRLLRLYNPYSGEHLYTTDTSEYAHLGSIGWHQEGTAWYAAASSSHPVMRLYNPYSGDHLYTTDLAEYASLALVGWRQEGTSFYASDNGGTQVYRLFNPYETVGTHLYTTSADEYANLASIGWRQEGTAWYALAG